MSKLYKSISIRRKDILYDVNFISWKTAKCRIEDAEARAEAQTDDEGAVWFERMLETAVNHLKANLRWCIYGSTGTIVNNAIKQRVVTYGEKDYPEVEQDYSLFSDDATALESPTEIKLPIEEYVLRFALPSNWRGNFDALANYVHRYIVDYILFEWFKITLPDEAPKYLASSEDWENKIINEARSEDVTNVFFRL